MKISLILVCFLVIIIEAREKELKPGDPITYDRAEYETWMAYFEYKTFLERHINDRLNDSRYAIITNVTDWFLQGTTSRSYYHMGFIMNYTSCSKERFREEGILFCKDNKENGLVQSMKCGATIIDDYYVLNKKVRPEGVPDIKPPADYPNFEYVLSFVCEDVI